MDSLLKDYQLLDPKLFRAFMAAARTENFTSAAAMAYMTQSGVSQHVAKLEEQVGLPLFKRAGKKVILTETGRRLARFIEEHVYATEVFLDTLRGRHEKLAGLVSYAMPPSCLMSPHFPWLLERRKRHADITLKVTLAPSDQVVQMVLADQVDFGFVTQKTEHPQLHLELFCQEEYILVGTDPEGVAGLHGDNVLEQRYVHYPGADVYYDYWLQHYCSDRPHMSSLALPVAGDINSIRGAIIMVLGGLGYGVFPRHCVQDLLDAGTLFEYQNVHSPLLNDIFIVTLAGHSYPRRVRRVLEWFFDMKAEETDGSDASTPAETCCQPAPAEEDGRLPAPRRRRLPPASRGSRRGSCSR